MREFDSGATRDSDSAKFDYEGFLDPTVVERFGAYMDKHRRLADGSTRASDNWKRGIPLDAYIKSLWRHFRDVWAYHRGDKSVNIEESLCAVLFNCMGYLFEVLKAHDDHRVSKD